MKFSFVLLIKNYSFQWSADTKNFLATREKIKKIKFIEVKISRMSYFLELELRRSGSIRPFVSDRRIWFDRLTRLRLSETKEITSVASGAIVSMDLDSAESRYLITGESSGFIRIFDFLSASPIRSIGEVFNSRRNSSIGAGVSSVVWYPFDSGLFAAAGADKIVKVFDSNSLAIAASFSINSSINQIAMSGVASRHSLIAAATGENQIRLCDLQSGAFSHALVGHKSEILSVAWAPHSEFQLVSGSADQVNIFDFNIFLIISVH